MTNSQPTSDERETFLSVASHIIEAHKYETRAVGHTDCDACLVADTNAIAAIVSAQTNAAAAARDQCVEKAREMIDKWDQEARTANPKTNHRTYINYSDAAWEIVTALQSLTLDQVQEKQ